MFNDLFYLIIINYSSYNIIIITVQTFTGYIISITNHNIKICIRQNFYSVCRH